MRAAAVERLGFKTLDLVDNLGALAVFIANILICAVRPPLRLRRLRRDRLPRAVSVGRNAHAGEDGRGPGDPLP